MTDLLKRLNLTRDAVISDDGDSFVTMSCHDADGRRVVLKYVHSGTADAHRRLRNEAALVKHLRVPPPLRLLAHRDDGPGYLVTEHDPGVLLRPDQPDAHVVHTIASALAQFQTIRPNLHELGIRDREHVATYYLKVLLKHLLHLWPAHISAGEAARCQAMVIAALPAICRLQVICHGDFLPTNLLYHADDDSVTFTDLEGFMCRNHPLFDVLAFFTISGLDLMDWSWQRAFLARYLAAGARALGLDPDSRDYRQAYQGILVFFLVYRMNEERIGRCAGSYFDGLGKRRFLGRKLGQLVWGRRAAWRDDDKRDALAVRARNLRLALTPGGYRQHLEAMHSPMTAFA
jgi:hypothetical protein